jgi:hypothetical protein
MLRRLFPALIFACAALAAPAAAHASTPLHVNSQPSGEPRTAKEALRMATKLKDGVGVDTGTELSVVLKVLADKLPELSSADRRRAERVLARPSSQAEANPDEDVYGMPEATPVCGTHFCIHYVAATPDAPAVTSTDGDAIPDYVQVMLREFENVYNVENVQMGWRPAKTDSGRGGNDLTDVYIKNIGPQGIFGYAAPDVAEARLGGNHWAAYLVMDNDYRQQEFPRYPDFLAPLQVTAAHEYNHVLQYGYDSQADSWLFEATATWMEDKVYDPINDYLSYLNKWKDQSTVPLTRFLQDDPGGENAKVYGDTVWNRWIDEHFGADTVRRVWEVSVETKSFAPASYNKALGEKGQNFAGVFSAFAAETAEWRSASNFFEEGNLFPDMKRALDGTLPPQNVSGDKHDFVQGALDHTAYALVDVSPRGQQQITLGGTFRKGVSGAIALVGRTGDDLGGTATVQIKRLPNGGAGKVTLSNASSFSRVTAVMVNADFAASGWSEQLRDWVWLGDDEPITFAVNDFSKPKLSSAKQSGSQVALKFSEAMVGLSTTSVLLYAPNGRRVRLKTIRQSENGRTVKLAPSKKLAAGQRYTVKLTNRVTDPGGNILPSASRTNRFATR